MTRNTYRLEDFVYDANAGVHVHPAGDLTEYRDGGEDYVLGVLKGAADRSSGSRELLGRIKDWPSRYHLSYLRANLLEGISELLARDSKVLEVGARRKSHGLRVHVRAQAPDALPVGLV